MRCFKIAGKSPTTGNLLVKFHKILFLLRFLDPTPDIPPGISWLNTLFFNSASKLIAHMELSSIPKEHGGWKEILELDIVD